MARELLVPPTGDVVTADVLKTLLRIDGSSLDATLTLWLPVAVAYVERVYGCAFLARQERLWFDAAEVGPAPLVLPVWPVTSIAEVRTYDAAGVAAVLGTADYQVDTVSVPARIYVPGGWPSNLRPIRAVAIDVASGYGEAADVPPLVVRALALLVAHWIESPDGVAAAGGSADELPAGVRALMHPLVPVGLA